MGVQSICLVKGKIKPLKKDGTTEADLIVPYYFRGSNVYTASSGIETATLISNVPQDKFDGSIPLTPVADLIRAGILTRVNVTVKAANSTKKRSYQLIVDAEQIGAIFDKTNGSSLDGLPFTLTTKTGTSAKGNIIKVTNRTEAYNP